MNLNDLKSELLWKNFLEFTEIPRPSGKEEEARNHIISWAKSNNFEHETDKTGNLIVRVPATKGYEKSSAIVIQGHIDMVAEKNSDSKVDPNTDPLDVYIDDGWITARGTTLGADNAIGVAAGMTIATDPDAKHGPLEILCTVDEETALTGAFALESSFVKGKKMLNLDSEELGVFYVGCAGGEDTTFSCPVDFTKAPEGRGAYKVSVSGLKGGHSGLDINQNRGNAIKLLGTTLNDLLKNVDFKLAHIKGGNKRNAIPRESEAHILMNKNDEGNAEKIILKMNDLFNNEFERTEGNISIAIEPLNEYPKNVISNGNAKNLFDLIDETPSQVIAMSKDIGDMVETSTNLGVLEISGNTIELTNCKRSSVSKSMDDLRSKFHDIAKKYNASVKDSGAYPGWEPNMNSELLKVGQAAWEELYEKKPGVKAIHAGLECGIIGEKYDGMDMISFGPDITGAHSPDEKLNIKSTNKFYNFLKFYLEKLI